MKLLEIFTFVFVLAKGFGRKTPQKPCGAQCPTTSEVRSYFIGLPSNCRRCVWMQCGFINSNNNDFGFGSCVVNTQASCSKCPAADEQHSRRIARCRMCARQQRGSQGLRRPETRPRTFAPTTSPSQDSKRFRSCSCFENEACPRTFRTRELLRRENDECRSCVAEDCGDLRIGSGPHFVSCVADYTQRCSKCSDHFSSCRACFRRCQEEPTRTPTHSLRPQTSHPPRPSTSYSSTTGSFDPIVPYNEERYCRDLCSKPGQCPAADDVIFTIQYRVSTQCRACIMELCDRRGEDENRSKLGDCMYQARESCDGCFLSDRAKIQRTNCARCLEDCSSREKATTSSSLSTIPTTTARTATSETDSTPFTTLEPLIVLG